MQVLLEENDEIQTRPLGDAQSLLEYLVWNFREHYIMMTCLWFIMCMGCYIWLMILTTIIAVWIAYQLFLLRIFWDI